MLLSPISIKRPVLAPMMSLALVLFGVISAFRLPVRELPDIDPPIVSVNTIFPGANAVGLGSARVSRAVLGVPPRTFGRAERFRHTERFWAFEPVGGTPTGARGTRALPKR